MSPERKYWVQMLEKLAVPVLHHQAQGTLSAEMSDYGNSKRRQYLTLEATSRVLSGIAPWLELTHHDDHAEQQLHHKLCNLARQALISGLDPDSPDYFNVTSGDQPLVDAGFLAHAILRAPNQLWEQLATGIQDRLVQLFKNTRQIRPHFSNWLLFSAMIEAALYQIGEEYDPMRVDYALRQHQQWYLGDGIYGDGPQLHCDYYNSYVIQPMLLDVLDTFILQRPDLAQLQEQALVRAQRYAVIQERMIAPDGSFPAIGRSIVYRCGAFQLLAQLALQEQLPDELVPAQVRTALNAIIERTLDAPGTFNQLGWLTVGLAGNQPRLGESYISSASVYLCTSVLLPLGLPATHEFWSAPPQDYSGRLIWCGDPSIKADRALR